MSNTCNAVLDDPVGESLRGHHSHLARRYGRALTYASPVATFVAVPVNSGPHEWAELAALLGPDGFADMFSAPLTPPSDWQPVFTMEGVQMVGHLSKIDARETSPGVVELTDTDVPDMLELVERTRPGPFWAETIRMGTYLGIREAGTLVAMAGERLHPPGWTEISAVCTAPEWRGRGFASALVRQSAARIIARGERPFIHVVRDHTGAIDLYRQLGFTIRRNITFRGFRVPS